MSSGCTPTVTGLPDVGPLVSRLIEEEGGFGGHVDRGDQLWRAFERIAVDEGNRDAAMALAGELYDEYEGDAQQLNNAAWALLTEDRFGGRFDELALKMSRRSNELSDHDNWAYVDTLALALFKTGEAEAAVKMEKKALALCGDGPGRDDVEQALARFEAALPR